MASSGRAASSAVASSSTASWSMAKQQRSRASARTPCRPGWGAASCPQEAHGRHAPATAASMALAHSTSPSSRTSPESWGLSSPSRPRKSSAADALLPSSIGPSLAAKASLAPTSSLRSVEHVPASEHVDEVAQEKVSGRGHCSKPPPPRPPLEERRRHCGAIGIGPAPLRHQKCARKRAPCRRLRDPAPRCQVPVQATALGQHRTRGARHGSCSTVFSRGCWPALRSRPQQHEKR